MIKGRTIVRVLLGASILIFALWYMQKGVNLDSMVEIIRQSNPYLLFLTLPIIIASHVVRARRWQTLLLPSNHPTHLGRAFKAVMIGYASNTIVPRSGEFIRPWVFARRENIPLGTSLSSVLVDRVLDVLTLLFGICLVMFITPSRFAEMLPGFTPTVVALRLALPMAIIVALITLLVFTPLGVVAARRLVARIHVGFAAKLELLLTTVNTGMRALGEPRLYVRLASETVILWTLYIIPLWMVAMSLPFLSANTLSLMDASIILVIIAVGVTIAPTPGALGVYQSFAQVALVVLAGATQTEGLAFGILTWLVNYGVALIVGAICWIIESRNGISLRAIRTSSD